MEHSGMKDDLDKGSSPQRLTLVAGGQAAVFDLWELMFPATKTQAVGYPSP